MTPPVRRTFGVEEEYVLVDPVTGGAFAGADKVLAAAERRGEAAQHELLVSQVEVGTPVLTSLDDLRTSLTGLRRTLNAAAGEVGCRLAALGAHPWASRQRQAISAGERYETLAEEYGHLARHMLICGCHVHVGVEDAELALEVSTRIRPWLSFLLALSANSPFWEGSDTGYASYRTTVFSRWPTAGPQGQFQSRSEYSRLIADLIAIDVIKDENMVYFDARPSNRYATVEVRVADVCTDVEDAVLIAGLARALVSTCALEALRGAEPVRVRQELLRAATWRASRSGLEGRLVDLVELRPTPAPEALRTLLAYVRPALEAVDDFEQVSQLLDRTLTDGGGAVRQRRVFERTGWLRQVVTDAVERTCPSAAGR